MNTLNPPAALAVAVLLLCGAASAQTTQLAPQKERITDEAVRVDQKAYEVLQGRIKGLNDRGRPVRDYHLSKSQCWLDVSFHEYTRNDRGAFPQLALSESAKLLNAIQAAVAPLPMETPLINDAARLRPDLWSATAGLRSHAGWSCAQAKAACAEVELVHAGNEFTQQQWRHAKPYVQIAEDLVAQSQVLAERCLPPPTTPPPPPPPVVAAVAPPLPPSPALPTAAAPVPNAPAAATSRKQLQLSTGVVFNFDKHDAANIRTGSLNQLQALAQRLKDEGWTVQSVRLSGHADRLNATGHSDYNQRLSERRVATVRGLLVGLGLDPALMRSQATGDGQQVADCDGKLPQAELRECLLPNRRVEVQVNATAQASATRR